MSLYVPLQVWFSTERTFIHWAKLSTVFAAAAAVLLTTGQGRAVAVAGLVVSVASVAILVHACVKQYQRNRSFRAGGAIQESLVTSIKSYDINHNCIIISS